MTRPELSIDPARTALVIIECQNGVVGPDSRMPDLVAAAKPVLPEIGRLARAARAAGAQVVHLTYVPALDNRSSNRNTPLLRAIADSQADWTADHPAVQVVEEIGVGEGDLVLPRHTGVSPTHGTELASLLRNAGVTTVVLAGVSLNVALPVTSAELADEGFRIVIAREAVAGTPVEHGESILRHTLRMLATLTTTDALITALDRSTS
ncbi:isochorismatase family protein [Peterkaempfera bronchialis]|nr:cysteine hydrolase family protein [Peterkaempfera bronchialis]